MTQNIKLIEELIKKNPNLSGNKIYEESKTLKIGIRKTNFYSILRKVRKLPEPSKAKKQQSIPTKFLPAPAKVIRQRLKQKAKLAKQKAKSIKPKVISKPKPKQIVLPIKPKPKKVSFDKTKFGKAVKDLQKKHGISEKRAIERARALFKIPKRDFRKLNKVDRNVLLQYKT